MDMDFFENEKNEWISFVNKFGCTFKQHELAQFLQGIVNGRITVNILTRMYQAEPDKEKAIKNVQQKIQLLLSPIAFHQDKDLSKGVADTITTAFVNGIIITSSELANQAQRQLCQQKPCINMHHQEQLPQVNSSQFFDVITNETYRCDQNARNSLPEVNSFLQVDPELTILCTFDHACVIKMDEFLLVRRTARDLIDQLVEQVNQTHRCNLLRVFKGASGVGKTCSLLLLAHVVKQLNMLVFYMNGRQWVGSGHVETKAQQFLKEFRRLNAAIIQPNSKIANLIKKVDDKTAVDTFRRVVDLLREQREWPIVFLIDECNAFSHEYQLWQNGLWSHFNSKKAYERENEPCYNHACPIGEIFRDFNTFFTNYGASYFTFSSSFNIKFNYTGLVTQVLINPMNNFEWQLIVNRLVETNRLPPYSRTFVNNAQELGELCGFLPRQLRFYQYAFNQTGSTYIHQKYNNIAKKEFNQRLEHLVEQEIVEACHNQMNDSIISAKLYLGDSRIQRLSPKWDQSGLLVEDDRLGYTMSCPALKLAFVEKFTFLFDQSLASLIKCIHEDNTINWRVLELAMLIKVKRAIFNSSIIKFYGCLNKSTLDRENLELSVDSIEYLSSNDRDSWSFKKGCFYICPSGQAVIDFFAIDAVSNNIFFIQVSKSCYSAHSTKYSDLFTTSTNEANQRDPKHGVKRKLKDSVYHTYARALPSSHPSHSVSESSGAYQLKNNEFYLYIHLDIDAIVNNNKKAETSKSTARRSRNQANTNEFILDWEYSKKFFNIILESIYV